MDCAATETALVDYHFAVGAPAQREAVHAHLCGCPACARRYLELKYAIDSGADLQARPSTAARLRLRAEVASLFPPARAARVRAFLTRPVPRYQVAAAMLCLLLLGGAGVIASWRAQTSGAVPILAQKHEAVPLREARRPRHPGFEAVDSARPMAVSLTYY
jgi:anti-sigma factor RsiW